ncbi:hypothetical protein [Polaromonas sp. DSR2-3-2]
MNSFSTSTTLAASGAATHAPAQQTGKVYFKKSRVFQRLELLRKPDPVHPIEGVLQLWSYRSRTAPDSAG